MIADIGHETTKTKSSTNDRHRTLFSSRFSSHQKYYQRQQHHQLAMRVKNAFQRSPNLDLPGSISSSWPNFDHDSSERCGNEDRNQHEQCEEELFMLERHKSRSIEELSSLHVDHTLAFDCRLAALKAAATRRSRSLPCYYVNVGENKTRVSSSVVSPPEVKERLRTMVAWFCQFDDDQKNLALKALLSECGPSQNHCLSVAMETRFHHYCPPNCQDLLSWLPEHLALYVFSFFDAVTLARSSQVCRTWHALAITPALWQRFCRDPKWQLSKTGQQKQIASYKLKDKSSIDWKRCFVERFRLRRNWLKGSCHVRTFEGHSQGITCVQFDDTRIVSGSSDKTIKVWNIRTNSPWSVMTLVGHSGTVRCLHLEGNRLVSGSSDCTIKVWDLSTQHSWSSIACKVTMVGHSDTVRCLQVDERKVVSGSYDRTLKVWDMRTGQCTLTLSGHEEAVLCLQFDDNKIVSGSCDRTIKVWSLTTGRCTSTLRGHQDAVTCLQFDDVRILSGSLDRTIKFWMLDVGQCIRTLDWMSAEGHTGVIRCLQADSWRFVSGGDDKTLKVWSLETGQRLATLRNHTDGVTCLQFNDSIIVSGSYDKTVKLWDFSVC